jgi:VWFA-related protein
MRRGRGRKEAEYDAGSTVPAWSASRVHSVGQVGRHAMLLRRWCCSEATVMFRSGSRSKIAFYIFVGATVFYCGAVSATAQSQNPATTAAAAGTGRISLDVVVTKKMGPPIGELQQQDFTILDNKAAQSITSFRAVDGRQAPVEVVLVVDDVNTGIERVAYERSEIDKVLKADGGHLAQPTTLAFLTDAGIKLQEGFTTDGNALSASLNQYKLGLHTVLRAGGVYSAEERFRISLDAMFELATHEAARPGRKFIVWVSPGWPLFSGPGVEQQMDPKQQQQIFDDVVRLSALLRQGRVTVYSVDPLGTADFAGRAFRWEQFTKGLAKAKSAEYGDIALQVIAAQSGGLVMTTSNDLAGELRRSMDDANAYYEISFEPPQGDQPHEYHHLEVKVGKAGLTARTRQGYYSQP